MGDEGEELAREKLKVPASAAESGLGSHRITCYLHTWRLRPGDDMVAAGTCNACLSARPELYIQSTLPELDLFLGCVVSRD